MKQIPFFSLLLCLYGVCGLHSQAVAHTRYIVEQAAPTYVVVETAPPAEIEDEVVPCPGNSYVWIKGHWQWDGYRWVRVHGHWVEKPHAEAIWMPGCWCEHHHHWRWTEGYWR